jgi:hypothetical protein
MPRSARADLQAGYLHPVFDEKLTQQPLRRRVCGCYSDSTAKSKCAEAERLLDIPSPRPAMYSP